MRVLFNPACSKCRELKHLLDEREVSWEPILYLEGELTRDLLEELQTYSGEDLSTFLRATPPLPEGEDVIDFLLANPEALQRPLVIHDGGVLIARPPQLVLERLLPD